MSIFFTPNGTLDLTTDPSDLPEEGGRSGAMQRCKNLRLDESGVAHLRDGSTERIDTSESSSVIWAIIEQAGLYYNFPATKIFRDTTSLETGLTSARWSGMKYNSYNSTAQNVFALNGTDRKRIEGANVYEWGIVAPSVAPTIAVGGGTGLTGDYNVRYTYRRKEGSVVVCESDPSDTAAAAVTLSNEDLEVNWTASADPQVTHVAIYRTEAGGAVYYHDQDVAIGTTTIDTDTSDGALGTQVATNHDRPPLGSFVVGPNYNGVCFIIKDNLLYYCLAKQPEYWPTTYYIEVSPPQFPGKSAVFWNGQLYYLTTAEIYLIQGTGSNTFFPFSQSAITGTQGGQAVEAVAGHGIYHVGSDGLYLFSNSDRKISQGQFEKLFRESTVNGVPGVDRSKLSESWIIQYNSKLYFGYADSSGTYPDNVLVFDLTSQRTWYYSYPWEIVSVAVDHANNRLLAGTTTGKIYQLEDTTKTLDDTTAISWEIESKDFSLQTRAHFPRYAKYDIDASSATSATGKIVLDGTVHQSHALTGNRNTRRRLVDTGNGERESLRVTGSGPISIYAIEAE